MGPVRQNPIQRTVSSVHMCVQFTVYNCTQYCTEQTWWFSLCPPDNHHCSDDVYLRERGGVNSRKPEVHNMHCPQKRTKPESQITCTENLVKFGHVVFGRPFVKRFPRLQTVVCLVCLSVCDVGVLWPNGWTDEDETWRAGRPWPWPHCVRWEPNSSPPKAVSFDTFCLVAPQR